MFTQVNCCGLGCGYNGLVLQVLKKIIVEVQVGGFLMQKFQFLYGIFTKYAFNNKRNGFF